MTKEIAIICQNSQGINWDEAWGMSLHERTLIVNQMKEMADKQKEAMDKAAGRRTI